MYALYVCVVGLSALLLFQIQPAVSKVILPRFGGGVSVWLTSLIFFQLALLLGYAAAHLLIRRLGQRRHLVVQAILVLLGLAVLPLRIRDVGPDLSGIDPSLEILLLLAVSVGLPYLVLSTTSPVVQHWAGVGPGTRRENPYLLYAFSNAGSLLGLLTYPILIEPRLSNRVQLLSWSGGYLAFALLLLACIGVRWRETGAAPPIKEAGSARAETPPAGARRGWFLLSLVPSAALLAITQHLTVDAANFPFLWVLPLSLYLVSFCLCFLAPGLSRPRLIRSVLVLLPILPLVYVARGALQVSLLTRALVASAATLSICVYFHGELERSKPAAPSLTAFYLWLSLGACAGSLLVGLVAPLVLRGNFEFTLVILVTLYGVLLPYVRRQAQGRRRLCHGAFLVTLALALLSEEGMIRPDVVYRGRSFYGTYKVREIPAEPGTRVAVRLLMQGTTVHGGEARYPDGRYIPATYFHEATGVGQAFGKLPEIERIGLVGLGCGVVSIYGREGQVLDFYEIDDLNIDIAWNQFDLLRGSAGAVRTVHGDGRLGLRTVPDGTYDLLVLDAFTSGAIPVHLLTVEAVKEYLRALRPEGLILFHVSNRHVRLQPILAGAARRLGLQYGEHTAPADDRHVKFEADWVAVTRSPEVLRRLTLGDDGWSGPETVADPWTDERSDLWSVTIWSR